MKQSSLVTIKGIVQGVGFRPWVYRVAQLHDLKGWVLNSRRGVITQLEGERDAISAFVEELRKNPPPLSRIERISVRETDLEGYADFRIRESEDDREHVTLISPDIAVCADCAREVFDSGDRRFKYPFTNCTNCGPRMSIIEDTPYDRASTSMKKFTLCERCREEYENPLDRRFHAQPNACPECGPSVRLLDSEWNLVPAKEPIEKTAELLGEGRIVAIKGIGGFHLAVDATDDSAVSELRKRKSRPHKPFALMVKDVESARKYCHVSREEEKQLQSCEAPVLLLKKKKQTKVAPSCAPGNPHLGVMIPYTPLHALLFEAGSPDALVMTSGNRSDEPLVVDEREVRERLAGIVDYTLTHNRDIVTRNDDSVATVLDRRLRVLRRSRGFAPYPIRLPVSVAPTIAYGAELKNTFALAEGKRAFISPHIGDLSNLETATFFRELSVKFTKWFRIEPKIVACDLHPGYLSTRFAYEAGGPEVVGVQHHFAHIVSCMAENGLTSKVIGVAFDGTGYGTDGKIWGCEFLVADFSNFERRGHLAYLPLPGGEAAIRRPYRTAVGYLAHLLGEEAAAVMKPRVDPDEFGAILRQVERGVFTPYTSSCGRFFDAVSSILGICDRITFEAQAAMALEFVAEGKLGPSYPYRLVDDGRTIVVDPAPILKSIVDERKRGVSAKEISRRFHGTLVEFTSEICGSLRDREGIRDVALSGGVFQNMLLLRELTKRLRREGFNVHTHSRVPTNDGGISLGQLLAANS